MKQQFIDGIKQTIDEIADGNIDNRNIDHLFSPLRFEKGTPLEIKEIGHFLAHNPKDSGQTYDLAKKFVTELLRVAEIGGALCTIPLNITQANLLKKLRSSLLHSHFKKDVISKLDNCSYPLMKSVIQLLSGSTMSIRNIKIVKCELSHTEEANGIFRLYIKVFPVATGANTTMGGYPPITFGPNTTLEAEFLRAVPPDIAIT